MSTHTKIASRVLVGHSLNCYAIKNYDNGTRGTPWSGFENRVEYRDKLGRKQHGSYRWRFVRCNCTYCGALVIFREDDVVHQLPVGKGAHK